MTFFEIFLPATAALLSLVGLVVAYWVITRCKKSEFMPTYYFIGFSIISVLMMSLSRISSALFGSPLFNYPLILDLMIAWSALFLFGALWQSYETSICVVPSQLED
ncbi:MAG: hypothetical protein ACI9LV_000475 [Candidatus Nanohaloarchaea archaeon]|jgi:hypothetical protein